MTNENLRLAVDIGGTFVDAMELNENDGTVRFRKASTTPSEPWKGVMNAIAALGTDLSKVSTFIHGTTLGLNAVIERRGALTGIITNAGLRDIYLLGRGNVPDSAMYEFQYERPERLVARRNIAGVPTRLNARGETVVELDEDELRRQAKHLVEEQRVESIAICFVHSYLNPESEQRAAAIVRELYPNVMVSVSTDIVREYREFERTSTTVLEAYIRPIFERYVDELEKELRAGGFTGQFLIMRSGGGSMTAEVAKRSPIPTLLSGPAGGVMGGEYVAREIGRDHVLTFDMGGTSLDVCIIDNYNAVVTHRAEMHDLPVMVPTYDLRVAGAGGGSIASVEWGVLKVGPRSAGAQPGPVCYGRGGEQPTVTDAAVALGYINAEGFNSTELTVDVAGAKRAIDTLLADPLSLSVTGAAAGVFEVTTARTAGEIRQITVERGHDPSDYSLLVYGGAGPLVAPMIAKEMGLKEVIIPFAPSGFSAWGMLSADVVADTSQTVMVTLADLTPEELGDIFDDMTKNAAASLSEQNVDTAQQEFERSLELRYLGQENSITVPIVPGITMAEIEERFHSEHLVRYGHSMSSAVQVLTARLRGIGTTSKPPFILSDLVPGDGSHAVHAHREAYDLVNESMASFPVYDRQALRAGDTFTGPALIEEGTSTTVVHRNQRVSVDPHRYLIITTEDTK